MVAKWWLLLPLLTIPGAGSRSVSVVVRHHQHFSVRDIVKRSYIRLSDKHETELGIDVYRPTFKTNQWTEQNPSKEFEAYEAYDVYDVNPEYDEEIDDTEDENPENDEAIDDTEDENPENDEAIDDTEDENPENDEAIDDTEDENPENDEEIDGTEDENPENDEEIDGTEDENSENDEEIDGTEDENPENDEEIDDIKDEHDDIESFLDGIDEASLEDEKGPRLNSRRKKREAREQWKHAETGANADKKAEVSKQDSEWHQWEEVTDEDIKAGQNFGVKETAEYIGITLLSVAGFVFVGICFIRDPVACVFAFGTGCPCCLICCPCIRAFTDKYLDTKRMVRESMNKYMPGVIVKEDGTMDFYEPTAEEIEILHEIIEEISG